VIFFFYAKSPASRIFGTGVVRDKFRQDRALWIDEVEAGKVLYSVASEWLTSDEAALYLKVERRTLLQWVRQGKVRAYILSGTQRHVWRLKTSDLDAMLSVPAVLSSDGRIK
jgi:excisionase family DNA binding protein